MQPLPYHLVDVFTDQPFGGNQLAVFTAPQDIDADFMQKLARELNLSESTFVLPPENEENDYRVRIFTPAVELPMAGHPTVGTAFVLQREGMIPPTGTVTFEEGVGTIPVTLAEDGRVTMQQPLPEFGDTYTDPAAIARMLSLDETDIDSDYPIQSVSTGVPFLFIPLTSLRASQQIRFRQDIWETLQEDLPSPKIFTFTTEVEQNGSTVHCRMFGPSVGIAEDPATGSASGPLGCYLVRQGIVQPEDAGNIISEQGIEMGRPSFIYIGIKVTKSEISQVNVGGYSMYMGRGALTLE